MGPLYAQSHRWSAKRVSTVVDIEKNCLFNVVIVSFHVNISSQLSFYDFVYIM